MNVRDRNAIRRANPYKRTIRCRLGWHFWEGDEAPDTEDSFRFCTDCGRYEKAATTGRAYWREVERPFD